jgi:transcriptional regulator with XRE-family HTH domain
MTAPIAARPVGALLREWRERRRLSQLELSVQVDVSARHLSFIETGRSRPTAGMIMRLTDYLDVPLRERNTVLLAGGYAPAYPQHGLDAPQLARVSDALRMIVDGHAPYPAVVLNRWWEMVDANDAIGPLVEGCAADLLEPPVNVLRLSLHPNGMAPRITNLGQWRAHLLEQLRHRLDRTGDEQLRSLRRELLGYPGGEVGPRPVAHDVVLPMRLRHGDVELAMFSIVAQVGTAADVTVEELVIESFYPADESTAHTLRSLNARVE